MTDWHSECEKEKARNAALSTRLAAVEAERDKRLIDCAASLAAAISLLEKGGKKAAPSDKMFAQMLDDYRASLARARAALKGDDHE